MRIKLKGERSKVYSVGHNFVFKCARFISDVVKSSRTRFGYILLYYILYTRYRLDNTIQNTCAYENRNENYLIDVHVVCVCNTFLWVIFFDNCLTQRRIGLQKKIDYVMCICIKGSSYIIYTYIRLVIHKPLYTYLRQYVYLNNG